MGLLRKKRPDLSKRNRARKGLSWNGKHDEAFKLRLAERNKLGKGKILSEAHRIKLSKAGKGRKKSDEHKRKIGKANIGRPAIRPFPFGENNPAWRGGISTENNRVRHMSEYKLWRQSVFERDNWTCVWCFQKGGKLNADHIKRFADFPELRFAIDNGRTLCEPCHKTTDTYGNKFKVK